MGYFERRWLRGVLKRTKKEWKKSGHSEPFKGKNLIELTEAYEHTKSEYEQNPTISVNESRLHILTNFISSFATELRNNGRYTLAEKYFLMINDPLSIDAVYKRVKYGREEEKAPFVKLDEEIGYVGTTILKNVRENQKEEALSHLDIFVWDLGLDTKILLDIAKTLESTQNYNLTTEFDEDVLNLYRSIERIANERGDKEKGKYEKEVKPLKEAKLTLLSERYEKQGKREKDELKLLKSIRLYKENKKHQKAVALEIQKDQMLGKIALQEAKIQEPVDMVHDGQVNGVVFREKKKTVENIVKKIKPSKE